MIRKYTGTYVTSLGLKEVEQEMRKNIAWFEGLVNSALTRSLLRYSMKAFLSSSVSCKYRSFRCMAGGWVKRGTALLAAAIDEE